MDQARALEASGRAGLSTGLLLLLLLAYALLIATPFVPGVEIGLALLLLHGADIVLGVYLATVAGLSLAYLAGRFLSIEVLIRIFADLRMARACAFLQAQSGKSPEELLAQLESRLPGRLGRGLLRSRYVLLGLLLNLPGNAMMGGGGGLCLMAGLSGLFRWRWVLATFLIAVAPVPLIVWIRGVEGLTG